MASRRRQDQGATPQDTSPLWILTRFNVQIDSGGRHLDREWLERRLQLFTSVTAPSVAAQTSADIRWLVFSDRGTPQEIVDAIEASTGSPIVSPTDGEYSPIQVRKALRHHGYRGGASCRLDSDDALLPHFSALVFKSIERRGEGIHTAPVGYQLAGSQIWLRCYVQNPFIAAYFRDERSVYDVRHWDLRGQDVHVAGVPPAWVQTIHGDNIANELRGVRIRGRRATRSLVKAGIPVGSRKEREYRWLHDFAISSLTYGVAAVRAAPRLTRVIPRRLSRSLPS